MFSSYTRDESIHHRLGLLGVTMPFYFNAADSKNSAREFIEVAIYTPFYQLTGEISVRVGIRLTDHLNTEIDGKFVAVKNAKIYNSNNQAIAEYGFLNVSTEHIILVCPLDKK